MSKNKKRNKDKHHKSRSQSISSTISEDTINFDDGLKDSKNVTFKIKTSKIMGRYMVAAEDLCAGSVVISECPLVVGPCTGCKILCLGCYQDLEEQGNYKFYKCMECGWPICSPKCSGLGTKYGHSKSECSVLKNTKSARFFECANNLKVREFYHAIAPLRCLLLKVEEPETYKILMDMEPHNEIRKNIPDLWNGNQRTVVDRIRIDWGLMEYTEAEIHNICGVLEVNAFEIGQQGVFNIGGLYPRAFLMSHDCVPNTSHSDEESDFRLIVRASTNIQKNQPITLSYAHTLQSTLKRRQHLMENKFFECKCKRCSDPTELGTYSGALLCPKCTTGLVLSTDPLDQDAPWSCNNKSQNPTDKCPGYKVSAKSMKLLVEKISVEVESIECNDVNTLEYFLQKYRNVLHPTHYLNLQVKLSLSQLYGKITGYIIHELSDTILDRKKAICREIMKIFDIVEPGLTRLRGVTLYELHAPIMIQTTRQFETGSLTKTELRLRLKEVVRCLKEADLILGFEPPNSAEGLMGKAAKDALSRIMDWQKIIGKL